VQPAADNSSAFHAAAALPPVTTARRLSSARNTGNRASGAIRGGFASDDIGVSIMIQ
jgi:hypothetical protein